MYLTVHIPSIGKRLSCKCGSRLLDVLIEGGLFLPAACGGKGTCGKCKVRLVDGKVSGASQDKDGYILSCKAYIEEDIWMEIPDFRGAGLDVFAETTLTGTEEGYGVALDIGTTTLAACLVRLDDGKTIKKTSRLNPQAAFGADVLSRMGACKGGKTKDLQALLITAVNEMIGELTSEKIRRLVVGGNATMLHLFLGVDPSPMGVYPFTPAFTCSKLLKGEEIGVAAEAVWLFPSVSAYVGGDIVADGLACEFFKKGETALLLDAGTNGELLLAHGGKVYGASTAAGPALEGACIECGMGGVKGAIDSVRWEDGKLLVTTILDGAAQGICGSGLIDAVAVLLREGLIAENGAFTKHVSPLQMRRKEDKFYLTDKVYLSQKDIVQYQLAKAAIAAGIETLLASASVDLDEVQAVYLAGGIGYYMDVENAAYTGLLPSVLASKIKCVGNAVLSGARACLLQENLRQEAEYFAGQVVVKELSLEEDFEEKYIENLAFENAID